MGKAANLGQLGCSLDGCRSLGKQENIARIRDGGNKNPELLFFVALEGCMRRVNRSGRCAETAWIGWEENAQGAERHPYDAYGNDRRDTAAAGGGAYIR